jgi:transcriptional regulator with XRE-family HTH domain
MDGFSHSLPDSLQRARKARRLSQLELALRLDVSQRHVSFVESGRARPSRELLTRWLGELDTPLALRNATLMQAGFAPAYRATTLDDPDLAQAKTALQHLLQAHEPMPALVLDAQWNLLQLNRGGQWLAATLMPPEALQPANGGPANLLDMLVHPMGLTRPLLNLREAGPDFLSQMRAEAAVQPTLAPKVEAFDALLRQRLKGPVPPAVHPAPQAPVLTLRFATPFGELAFFRMFTTFGTPQDITLASLRVEHMFAADEATQAVVRSQVH